VDVLKAALFDEIKSMKIINRDLPIMKQNEVLIQVITTGICGSEIHAYNGSHPFRKPPSILGHEVVGVVEKVGSNVFHLVEGDRVTVEPHYGCEECSYCVKGDYHLCHQKVVLGTESWQGGFAEYITAPATTVYKLPSELPSQIGVLTEPLAVGIHAVRIADVKKGDKIAILGAGPIGLLVSIAAHEAGAEVIFLTDMVDHNLDTGKKLGATDVVNSKSQSVVEYLNNRLLAVDKVFITVGIKSVFEDALQIVRKKGKIINLAIFENEVGVDLNKVFMSEIQILGSSMYVKEDFLEAIRIISEGLYPFEILTRHSFSMNEINEALNVASIKKDNAIKVLVKVT
jgi:L-iditol 2-dehydrogenase